jgi:nucleoside phosphorylase
MPDLDPAGPILAVLFGTPSSDTVIEVIDRAGLHIDWTLNGRQSYSHKTRKREYRTRVGGALDRLSAVERTKCLSHITGHLLERQLTDVDQLNRMLASTGWLYDGELIELVQGPIDPGVAEGAVEGALTAVIITALELEANAVKEHLAEVVEEVHERGTIYFVGRFDGAVAWRVAVVIVGQGNATAAAEVERAVAHFNPRILLLVGIAGALKDLDLGDVVAADKVYGYERGKAAEEFLPRPTIGLSTYPAIQRARAEASTNEWRKRIKPTEPERQPNAVVAPIAAGEKVVASMDSPEYRSLRTLTSDAVAVEMEGAGFLSGAHLNLGVNALVVRGISDRIEGKAAADATGSQPRAARHAAAFAFQCLANFVRPRDGTGERQDQARRSEIDRLLSESRGRSIARWQGAGLSQEMATAFADESLGGSEALWRPAAGKSLVVLLAEFGAGKSLLTERLYQEALKRFAADPRSPIPIYLELIPSRIPSLADLRAAAAALGGTNYNRLRDLVGSGQTFTESMAGHPRIASGELRIYSLDNLTSQSAGRDKGEGAASWFGVDLDGRIHKPSLSVRWKTNEQGSRPGRREPCPHVH